MYFGTALTINIIVDLANKIIVDLLGLKVDLAHLLAARDQELRTLSAEVKPTLLFMAGDLKSSRFNFRSY